MAEEAVDEVADDVIDEIDGGLPVMTLTAANAGASGADIYGKSGWESGFSNGVKVRTYAENHACEIEVVGKFTQLSQPKTGDGVGSYSSFLPTAPSGESWYVQNSTLSNDQGGVGTLRISCVAATSADGAYDTTYDIDMQEVQRSLKQHPKILADSTALFQIQMWEKTPEAIRTYSSNGSLKFRYYLTTENDTEGVLTDVTNNTAESYMMAVTAGIETYNVYLPVVTKTSKYMKVVGIDNIIPYSNTLGRFNSPPVYPAGYATAAIENHWFKNTDRYSRANNGTWTRTEQWTYTDDTTHSWIYQELSSPTNP